MLLLEIWELKFAKTHYLPQNQNSPMFAHLFCIFTSPFYFFSLFWISAFWWGFLRFGLIFPSDFSVGMQKAFILWNILIFVESLRIGILVSTTTIVYQDRDEGWEILIQRAILWGNFLEKYSCTLCLWWQYCDSLRKLLAFLPAVISQDFKGGDDWIINRP